MTDRPKRRMPPIKRILEYRNIKEPHCQKCLVPMRPKHLERAHLIDRFFGGLDGVQNLVLLCSWCHKRMPSFCNGEESAVLSWLAEHWESGYHEIVRIEASRSNVSLEDMLRHTGCTDLHCYVVCLKRMIISCTDDDGYWISNLAAEQDAA